MARGPRWQESDIVDGIGEFKLHSWRYFGDFINKEMLDYGHYIWRGQRTEIWKLEPTLDRSLKSFRLPSKRAALREQHLKNFKFAVRGRRGSSPIDLEENDWWALGQHHGLYTPLLDWTTSPYAAAYFGFFSEGPDQTSRRVVYALNPRVIEEKSEEIKTAFKGVGRAPIVEFIRPMANDNPRLVNQSGLFSRAPNGEDLEAWVKKNFQGHDKTYVIIKVTIPNKERSIVMRSLNRMNINHLTLFPDLYGSSKFCNIDLEIDKY